MRRDDEVIEDFSVGAFGSCRIHTPLTLLSNEAPINFKTDLVIGYLHNPLEILQAVRLLKGDLKAPSELASLININAPNRLVSNDYFAKLLTNVDMLMIEISSIRIVELRGWQLQINRLRELFKPFGLDERQFGKLFKEDLD